MLEELIKLHHSMINGMQAQLKRYLFDAIDWDNRVLCVLGARGVGKTTLLCHYYLEYINDVSRGLYISADNIHVLSQGLLAIASEYFDRGGDILIIDEVHKYPNWSIEIKNIIDIYKTKQIIFSGSSTMELKRSKADLSRRVVYYELLGLSFREYLQFSKIINLQPVTLDEIINAHTKIINQFTGIDVLKVFKNYLEHGYYPFFLEKKSAYLHKLNNVIEKIIFEDIPSTRNLQQGTITQLKKLLWLVATSVCLVPNVDKISKNLGVSRAIVYDCLEYLEQSGLTQNIYPIGKGMRQIRKPGKIFLNNSNLLYAINGDLNFDSDIGAIRETFFTNQLKYLHKVNTHDKADFEIDERWVFEIGGKNKKLTQVEGIKNAYLAVDGIEAGFGQKIPLYLFGCLY